MGFQNLLLKRYFSATFHRKKVISWITEQVIYQNLIETETSQRRYAIICYLMVKYDPTKHHILQQAEASSDDKLQG